MICTLCSVSSSILLSIVQDDEVTVVLVFGHICTATVFDAGGCTDIVFDAGGCTASVFDAGGCTDIVLEAGGYTDTAFASIDYNVTANLQNPYTAN